jgi:hypothetical protein
MRIITRHCNLRRQNAIVLTGINPPPTGIDISCRLCGLADETGHHLAVFCEALGEQRQRYLRLHVLDDYLEWVPSNLDKCTSLEIR